MVQITGVDWADKRLAADWNPSSVGHDPMAAQRDAVVAFIKERTALELEPTKKAEADKAEKGVRATRDLLDDAERLLDLCSVPGYYFNGGTWTDAAAAKNTLDQYAKAIQTKVDAHKKDKEIKEDLETLEAQFKPLEGALKTFLEEVGKLDAAKPKHEVAVQIEGLQASAIAIRDAAKALNGQFDTAQGGVDAALSRTRAMGHLVTAGTVLTVLTGLAFAAALAARTGYLGRLASKLPDGAQGVIVQFEKAMQGLSARDFGLIAGGPLGGSLALTLAGVGLRRHFANSYIKQRFVTDQNGAYKDGCLVQKTLGVGKVKVPAGKVIHDENFRAGIIKERPIGAIHAALDRLVPSVAKRLDKPRW